MDIILRSGHAGAAAFRPQVSTTSVVVCFSTACQSHVQLEAIHFTHDRHTLVKLWRASRCRPTLFFFFLGGGSNAGRPAFVNSRWRPSEFIYTYTPRGQAGLLRRQQSGYSWATARRQCPPPSPQLEQICERAMRSVSCPRSARYQHHFF